MSIRYRALPDGTVEVLITQDSVQEFKQLVFRGSNTWQERSNDMDDFCQIVANGKVIQSRPVARMPRPENCMGHPKTCNCPFHAG